MPLPTEAAIQAAIGYAIKLDATLYDFLSVTGTTWIAREKTYLEAVPSDCTPAAEMAQSRMRGSLNAALLMTPDRLAPLWNTYSKVAALPPGDFWYLLQKYMYDNSLTVKNRAFSFGSWSSVTGTGTGTINRLTKDEFNFTIEGGFAEAKRAECIRDQNNGAQRHEEVFRISGAPAGKDSLELIGTGRFVDVACLSPQSSSRIVPNPSFENVVGDTGSLASITGWTVGSSITNFDTITSDYYRDNPLASTNRSLRISANDSIKTSFTTIGLNWNPRVPLYAQLAFKRESSCDGNLNIAIGNVTKTVALSAQSGWTILQWKIDTNAWYKAWKKSAASGSLTNAAVTLSLDSRTTGTLLIDDFIIGPYTNVDSAWVAMVGGATPFLYGDYFTVTDSSADTGILQTCFARRYGQYLPHTSGSPTWADP